MGLFNRKKAVTLPPVCMLNIRGMEYCTKDIEAIGTPLKGYNLSPEQMAKHPFKDYYKLWFNCDNVQLIPEPTNKADKNAIMVVVDGKRIGYVPAESTAAVRQYMALPHTIAVNIYGGYFKTWVPNEVVSSFKPYSGELVIRLIDTTYN